MKINHLDKDKLHELANSLEKAKNAIEVLNIIENASLSKEDIASILYFYNTEKLYDYLPKEYQEDKVILFQLLFSSPERIKEKISDISEQDLYEIMNNNNEVYKFLPESYKDNRNISLKYLETEGSKWESVPLKLRKDFLENSIIVDRLLKNVNIFKYLSEEFRSEPLKIKKAFNFNKNNIRLIKDKTIKKELIMNYMKEKYNIDGILMDVIVTEFNSDMEVMSKAIKKNEKIYSLLDINKQNSIEFIKILLSLDEKNYMYHDRVKVDLLKHKTLKMHFNEIISILNENYPDKLISRGLYQISVEKKIINEDYNGTLTYEKLNTMLNNFIFKKDLDNEKAENKLKVLKIRKF